MTNKARLLSGLLACVWVAASITLASAGDVKLVSDNWDIVCRVEIVWGPDAPDGMQVEHHADVQRNWSITKPEKLCYRRPSTADNCDSGMTQWKTPWRCATATDSGVTELSLE